MQKRYIFAEQNKQKDYTKDWRHAFVEFGVITANKLELYSGASAIKINEAHSCTQYQMLLAYVTQFDLGGFWLNEAKDLYVVTNSTLSDEDATYENAMRFIENWKSQKEK